MKKSILQSTFIVAILTMACYGGMKAYAKYVNGVSNNLLFDNVEALTGTEPSSDSWKCWSQLDKHGGGVWQCGVPCIWHKHKKSKSGQSTCHSN